LQYHLNIKISSIRVGLHPNDIHIDLDVDLGKQPFLKMLGVASDVSFKFKRSDRLESQNLFSSPDDTHRQP
jgi:hypothetical protein